MSSKFTQSPQRSAILEDFIVNDTIDKHEQATAIKKYVPTRWCSYEECLERIIQLEESLIQYFEAEGTLGKKRNLFKENVLFCV